MVAMARQLRPCNLSPDTNMRCSAAGTRGARARASGCGGERERDSDRAAQGTELKAACARRARTAVARRRRNARAPAAVQRPCVPEPEPTSAVSSSWRGGAGVGRVWCGMGERTTRNALARRETRRSAELPLTSSPRGSSSIFSTAEDQRVYSLRLLRSDCFIIACRRSARAARRTVARRTTLRRRTGASGPRAGGPGVLAGRSGAQQLGRQRVGRMPLNSFKGCVLERLPTTSSGLRALLSGKKLLEHPAIIAEKEAREWPVRM